MGEFKNGWTLSSSTGELTDGRTSIYLEPRLMRLAQVLLTHEGQMVSREDLGEEVWKDIWVNPESLTRAVFDLRKEFNRGFSDPPLIKTYHKRGYMMTLPTVKRQPVNPLKVIKSAFYVLVTIIVIVLVIRGLQY